MQIAGANLGLNKTIDDLTYLRSLGCDSVRWQLFYIGPPNWQHYVDWLAGELVNINSDVLFSNKIIVLMTPFNAEQLGSDKATQSLFVETWQLIATALKENHTIAGFELINEPTKPFRLLQAETAEAIKRIDNSKTIIGAPKLCSPKELGRPIPGIDSYSVHIWDDLRYTHQGVYEAFKYPRPWKRTETDKYIKLVRAWQLKTKKKIWITEFGCARWAPNCKDWLSRTLKQIELYHWPWTYHAFREGHAWDQEYFDKYSNWDAAIEHGRSLTDRMQVLIKGWSE